MYRRTVLYLALAAVLVLLAGCGGSNTPAAANNPVPVPAPTPPGTPAPPPGTPPPPPPLPGAGANAEKYMIHLVTQSGMSATDVGQVIMNASANDGAGSVTLHNVDASKNYTLQFCPQSGAACTSLGSFTTDAGGVATFNFKFSQPGTWVGYFQLSGGSVPIADGLIGGAGGGQGLQAPFYPVKSVTTGIATMPEAKLGSDPLASGQLSINNGVVTATLKGAAPNNTYSYVYVLGYANYGGSSDYGTLKTFTTDASGNGSGDFGEIFNAAAYSFMSLITDDGGAEYVAGFRVQ